ncbi:C40 family peptidase [Streptomyces sp. NEAU-Y11]|uniref:C40 family peptidase n=1 Tax=Streptomyces cucumeris TaxID=2962890 RepID=UPI0020C8458B|nr:C40 family peptidase [Streptomyces sp. NEAU-Y11]MCP9209688.1 C40 family peptidase [Streptomyces sp. NEAU-Y11]
MNRMQRVAVAASSLTISASMMVGCGALHDAPISNAKSNKNSSAIEEANSYKNSSDGSGKPESKRKRGVPQGDMKPVAKTSKAPAWAVALNWAETKLGRKYVWGGESEAEGGYDCSGLTQAAYARAGIKLPRVANDQYATTNVHPKWADLRPGDLVFFGETERGIHHVGLYVGSGMMLHAPNSHSVIRFNKVHYMSDYYGATRVSS